MFPQKWCYEETIIMIRSNNKDPTTNPSPEYNEDQPNAIEENVFGLDNSLNTLQPTTSLHDELNIGLNISKTINGIFENDVTVIQWHPDEIPMTEPNLECVSIIEINLNDVPVTQPNLENHPSGPVNQNSAPGQIQNT